MKRLPFIKLANNEYFVSTFYLMFIVQRKLFHVFINFFLFLLSSTFSDITNAFLLTYQIGTCCIYVVFVASNIKAIVDYFTGVETDVRLFMVIILLPLILINWVNISF